MRIHNVVIFFLSLLCVQQTYGQYCTPTYGVSCTSDDFIDNFSFNTIVNNNTGCNGNPNNYIFYSSFSTTVTPGNAYPISMQSGPSWSQGFGVWIDYNIDGDFADPGEHVYSSGTSSTAVFTGSVTIPGGATLGTSRLRVACEFAGVPTPTDYCGNFTFGECEDYEIIIGAPTPMMYVSSQTFQNTPIITRGSVNEHIISVKVNTSGSLSPISLNKLKFTTTGTTNVADITNARLWYTGNIPTFATTTQVGTTIAAPSGAMYFNSPTVLLGGGNYFWLTYDIPTSATMGNVVDATCDSLYLSTPLAVAPVPTAPTGNRLIDYCPTQSTSVGSFVDAWISGVTVGSISNLATVNDHYTFYAAQSTPLEINVPTPFTINTDFFFFSTNFNLGIWIDYDHDGVFNTVTEEAFMSTPFTLLSGDDVTGNITVPIGALLGPTRMRINYSYAFGTMPTPDPCGDFDDGEVEDYIVNIQPFTNLQARSILVPTTSNAFIGYNNPVTVKIRNTGDVNITNPQVSLQSMFAPLVSETYTGTINAGDSINYTFTGYYVPNTLGNDTLKVWVDALNDNTPSDDTVKKAMIVKRADLKADFLVNPITDVLENSVNNVTFVIKNLSNDNVSNFPVRYKIGAAAAVTETYTGSIAPNDTVYYTFATPYNATTLGVLPFKIWTDLAADQDRNNDTIKTTLRVDRVDMKLAAIITPTTSVAPSTTTPVKVALVNKGTRSVTNPLVSYRFNTNSVITETATSLGVINPGDSVLYTFSTLLNTGVTAFTLTTFIKTTDDVTATNDTLKLNGTSNTNLLIDARAESIVSPLFVNSGTPTTLTVRIRNLGVTPLTNVQVYFKEPSTTAVTETYTGTINAGSGANYTFTAQYTPSSSTPTLCIGTTNPNGFVDANTSNDSTCVTFRPNSIDDQTLANNGFVVYPNPTDNECNVALSLLKAGNINIEILDVRGVSVMSNTYTYGAGSHVQSFSVQHLSSGMYLCKVTDGTRIQTKPIVISRP